MSRFDEVIDRSNTNCEKYDFKREYGKPEDVLPLWVADMDFRAPEEVLEALHAAVSHGIFGYTGIREDYYTVLADWFTKYFDWRPEQDWLVSTPGVIFAINTAIRVYTEEKDAVLIQTPVYHPFAASVMYNRRKLIENKLLYQNGHYEIDFKDMEEKIREEKVKLFILCSPHNPVGRVWTREELDRMADICLRHKVIVLSDEIHCDFTYPGHQHTVFASLSVEAEQRSIICTAPSKTFNLAGLQTCNIWIANPELREAFCQIKEKETGCHNANMLGLIACKAAYERGGVWLAELKEYLQGNLTFVRTFLQTRIPQITLVEPEGTYLLWLDCSGLFLGEAELEELIVNKAKLWLNGGNGFGGQSGQFERLNMTCPRSILERAMLQLEQAVEEVKSNCRLRSAAEEES